MVAKDLALFGITNNNVRASNSTEKSVLLAATQYVKFDFLQNLIILKIYIYINLFESTDYGKETLKERV